ncbi:AraC family transcriptional regulator [Escherichia coli]|uniref:AraC family transcriptional regulator n=1 Tax=Escherichia coli TaxID=562 RepID=UPI000B427BF0|nr:AraC family transcriptional regulator [Escherichia coli]EFJ7371574.1 helix-turn-helix transcriptional regulator [Escherichia coli]OWC41994.1 hypothetical protein A8F92_02365 [Escherichia coli]RCP65669.1 AraC family transcriptional regulator [Escherichia coli]CAD5789317.1 putative fimbrial operon positive regulatory protein FanR [Escherichia coli]CAD5791013.1 putative fimbrial operon positive regulatory protein FanR [Escherichia coli]
MTLNNFHLYNHTIIYATNCDIYIKKNLEQIHIPQKTIAVLEKNILFDLTIIRKDKGLLYESIDLDMDTLLRLRSVLEPCVQIQATCNIKKRKLNSRVFKISTCNICVKLFEKLKRGDLDSLLKVYKLAYIFSKCENLEALAMSIYTSVSTSFSEKIKKIFMTELSKKWKVSDIADKLYITEVTVRKKLEQEKTNFNQLLLDVRMNQAIKLIIQNENNISSIASLIGYENVSYFVRVFKNYFGVTPKQLHMEIKDNHCWV